MRMLASTILILLFFWVMVLSVGIENSSERYTDYVFKTEPAQFNLPIDTTPYFNFILIPWDFQLFSFPWSGYNWYPTCGGCIVYDQGWPLGRDFYPNGSSNDAKFPSDSTLCLDTIKKSPVVEDSLLVRNANISPRKSWRYKFRAWFQNLRSAGRKNQDSTINAKVRIDPKISEKGSPTAM
jgi:hypothetical protein